MKRGLNRTFSVLLTMMVIGILLMAGPASAVSVNISNISDTTPVPGDTVTFTAEVEVNVDENIPINQVELQINTGANEYHCYYRVDGSFVDADPSTPASFCTDFTLTRDTSIDSYGYSADRYGFGYSIDGPANISFGPGYGYGYGPTPVSLRYSIAWDTTDASGIYDVRFQATAMDSDGQPIFTYTSEPQQFTVSTPIIDNAAPIISILGNNPAFVTINTSYTDAGATAYDAVEGTVAVTSSGSVNTGTIGTYFITYEACDSVPNCATATRTVFVIAEPTPPAFPVWVGGNVVNTFGTGADIDVYSNQLVDFELTWGTSPDNLDSRTEAWDADWARIRIEGLTPLTKYYYRVMGCNQFGSCDWNDVASFDSSTPHITSTVHSITDHAANFTSSSDVEVDFTLNYGIGMPNNAVGIGLDTTTSEFRLEGLEEGETYTYYVYGCTAENVCGTTPWANFTTLNIPPSITHTASAGIGVIIIEGTTDENATIMVTLGTDTRLAAGTAFGEEFSGLAHDTTYSYTIQACDAKANCDTVSGTVTTPPLPDTAPAISASVSPSATSAQISASSNEEVSFTVTVGSTTYPAGTGTSVEFTLPDLQPSTGYTATIQGCNALCGSTTLDFVTTAAATPTSGGSGGGGSGGGSCASGFERQNGQCVRIESTSGNGGSSGVDSTSNGGSGDEPTDETPVIYVDVPIIPEDEPQPFSTADVGEGNLLTGLVTDENAGAGSSNWLWFSALAGAIILGIAGYFVLRRH